MHDEIIRKASRAIRTKFLPPTNHKGARYKAWLVDDLSHNPCTITLSMDYGLNPDENHNRVAEACLARLRSLKGFECWMRPCDIYRTYLGKDGYAFALYFHPRS